MRRHRIQICPKGVRRHRIQICPKGVRRHRIQICRPGVRRPTSLRVAGLTSCGVDQRRVATFPVDDGSQLVPKAVAKPSGLQMHAGPPMPSMVCKHGGANPNYYAVQSICELPSDFLRCLQGSKFQISKPRLATPPHNPAPPSHSSHPHTIDTLVMQRFVPTVSRKLIKNASNRVP